MKIYKRPFRKITLKYDSYFEKTVISLGEKINLFGETKLTNFVPHNVQKLHVRLK